MMDPVFFWLESTAISIWVRESISLFAFPGILAIHTIGMAFVVGITAALTFGLFGLARFPVRDMERFFPILWIGFWVNAASGLALLMGYPTKALTNPVFYLKLTLILVAVSLLKPIGRRVFGESPPSEREARTAKVLAAVSLACWTGAIVAGRLLAYTYNRLTVDM